MMIKLSNIQLIPILAYRLIYNSLPNKHLDTLDHSIWVNIASQGKLSLRTPNKTKYSPRHTLGLGITKISHVTHTQAINHFLRYTSNEGPPTSNRSIQHTLFHCGPASNLLQDMLITSAHHFSIQTHNIPHHNPCQVRSLPLNSAIQVAFLDHSNENSILLFPGTTIQHNLHSTSVQFSDNIFHLHDTHHLSFITQKGNELSSFITTPTHPTCPTTLQDFPISHTTTLSTTHYFQLKSNQNIPLPNFSHLDFWGCHDLLNALQSNTTYSIIYTDGSDDPNSSNPSGSAAIISLQPNDHTIITSPSPLKGSYPAEIYAIIIFPILLFLQLGFESQPAAVPDELARRPEPVPQAATVARLRQQPILPVQEFLIPDLLEVVFPVMTTNSSSRLFSFAAAVFKIRQSVRGGTRFTRGGRFSTGFKVGWGVHTTISTGMNSRPMPMATVRAL